MKLLAVISVVLVAFAAAPAMSRRGPAFRSLLQTTNTSTPSYNYTLELLSYTNLANITNTTIFALENQDWVALAQFYNGTGFDFLLNAVKENPAVAQEFGAALSSYIVNGTHTKAHFNQTVQYTSLAGNTLSVDNNGTDYLLTFLTYPNGTGTGENGTFPFTILSFDNEWQGNIVHVIGAMNGTTNATNGTTA